MNDTVQFIIKVMNFHFAAFPFQTPTDFQYVFQLHLQRLKSHPNNALILDYKEEHSIRLEWNTDFLQRRKLKEKKQKQKHRKLNLLHFLL